MYFNLSKATDSITQFDKAVLLELQCTPCKLAKMQRAPVKPSTRRTTLSLELVHLDVYGKVEPSISRSMYAVAFPDD